MSNLLNESIHTNVQRKAILDRAIWALLQMPEARWIFKGSSCDRISPEQMANWEARQTLANLMRTFPETHDFSPAEASVVETDATPAS